MKILSSLKKPILISFVLMFVCGIAYPLLLTGIAQLVFSHQANGSLIEINGKIVGSELVGQSFTSEKFMQGRPSAVGYNTYAEGEAFGGAASGSANYSASNPKLIARVQKDIDAFLKAHPKLTVADIPADLITASASGLDPDISPASAQIQIPQLAENTGLSKETLGKIVANNTKEKFLGIFGESRVNVLGVNLAIAKELNLI